MFKIRDCHEDSDDEFNIDICRQSINGGLKRHADSRFYDDDAVDELIVYETGKANSIQSRGLRKHVHGFMTLCMHRGRDCNATDCSSMSNEQCGQNEGTHKKTEQNVS